jgi:uncharacterized protein YjiS (DUF1127 family)
MRHETFETGSIDVRSLSPAQRTALQLRLIREAHAARARAMQRTFMGVAGWLRRLPIIAMQAIGEVVRSVRAAHIRRRDRREGVAQLRAMSDYELRDIGLSRSGIRNAALSDERDATLRN